MSPARPSFQQAHQGLTWAVDSTKSPSGQVTTDAPSLSLMREEPSQLIYHDKIFQKNHSEHWRPGANCLVFRYKSLLWMTGDWFGQRPEVFNIPFAQQEAQSNTWQRVTALWPWPEVIWSPHKETLYSLSPSWPWSNHPKVDPQLQQRKLILGTFCLFWEAHQFMAFISLRTQGEMSAAWV